MKIEITFCDGEDTCSTEVDAKYVVCDQCEGIGKILNPSIANHAYTQEEMQEDPDFYEEYRKGASGGYGVQCPKCEGLRVVLTPDLDKMDSEIKKGYLQYLKEVEESEAYSRWEIENGA